MLEYEPGSDVVRRLDPRAKLAVQIGFAAGVFAHTTPLGLAAFTLLTLAFLAAGRLHPIEALREYGPFVPIMVLAPVVAGIEFGPPWFDPQSVVAPALASYRTLLLLALGALYVKSTRVRESRAAIEWAIPGRLGRLLGVGVGTVFRLVPMLQRDLGQIRAAMRARLGSERPAHRRMAIVGRGGLRRSMTRADRLSVALRSRALSWNPTEPTRSFGWADAGALAVAVLLAASAVVGYEVRSILVNPII